MGKFKARLQMRRPSEGIIKRMRNLVWASGILRSLRSTGQIAMCSLSPDWWTGSFIPRSPGSPSCLGSSITTPYFNTVIRTVPIAHAYPICATKYNLIGTSSHRASASQPLVAFLLSKQKRMGDRLTQLQDAVDQV